MQQEDLQWLLGQAAEPLHQTNIQIILVPDFCHASVLFASSGIGQPALSMNVTIECQGPEKGLHFILLKSRERKASQWAEEDRSTAEFPLSLMSPEDAGTYACQYHRKGKRFLLSEPSDPVELRLRDPTLSRPSIRIRPKPQISLGLNATIECQGPEYYFHLTFFLFKSGNLIASQKEEPMKNTTQFLLSSVRLEDAGSYSCRYQRIVPFAQSEPSDAVELTVTGEGCAQHVISAGFRKHNGPPFSNSRGTDGNPNSVLECRSSCPLSPAVDHGWLDQHEQGSNSISVVFQTIPRRSCGQGLVQGFWFWPLSLSCCFWPFCGAGGGERVRHFPTGRLVRPHMKHT
uniref:Ig-like domain-containing protein n=1 Tax=Varanus komodoensis TaxID=61221 RepID=A0A8D2LJN6_VARKO